MLAARFSAVILSIINLMEERVCVLVCCSVGTGFVAVKSHLQDISLFCVEQVWRRPRCVCVCVCQ